MLTTMNQAAWLGNCTTLEDADKKSDEMGRDVLAMIDAMA